MMAIDFTSIRNLLCSPHCRRVCCPVSLMAFALGTTNCNEKGNGILEYKMEEVKFPSEIR